MKWLDRTLIAGPYLGLALSEAEYHEMLTHLNVPKDQWRPWVIPGADAATHEYSGPDGEQACIVTMREPKDKTPVQIACLLVHEAVHVWQNWSESVGERQPSVEFEAYAVQTISQRLMEAYVETLE